MAKPYMCGDEAPIYVPSGGCDCNYTIKRITTLEYADAYALMLNGEQVGATINIPKDQVVSSGVVNTVVAQNVPYDGAIIGDKYITLTIANSEARIYIPMKEVMGGGYIVVDELPDIGDHQHIYLVPNGSGGYDRYIYSDDEWVDIGDTEVDLSNYYNKQEVDALVAGYIRENANGDVAITRNITAGNNIIASNRVTGATVTSTGTIVASDYISSSTNMYADNFYARATPISLGHYHCAGELTSNCATLRFCIPTGRVFRPNTTVDHITGQIEVRASNSESAGIYIISSSSSPVAAGYVNFNTSSSLTFYNGNGQSKTLAASKCTVSLQGGTNLMIEYVTGSDWYFSGNATVGGHINNNAATVSLWGVTAYMNVPS